MENEKTEKDQRTLEKEESGKIRVGGGMGR